MIYNSLFRNWLAGFIDGEGCITATYNKYLLNNYYPSITPHFILGNTDKKIMYYLGNLFQIKIKEKQRFKKHKILYEMRCESKKAVNILKLVYPYLRLKKKQAKLCLELYKTINYFRKTNKKGQFKKLDKRTFKKRVLLYKKLRKLNKRGV